MKKYFLIALCLIVPLSLGIIGCNHDELTQDETETTNEWKLGPDGLYTIQIIDNLPNNWLSARIVNAPDNNPFSGYWKIVFPADNLSSKHRAAGNRIDVKILKYCWEQNPYEIPQIICNIKENK